MSAADLQCLHADGEGDLGRLASDGAMSINDSAEFIGASRAFIYELLRAGTIQGAKLGRRRVIYKRSLVNYLTEHAT